MEAESVLNQLAGSTGILDRASRPASAAVGASSRPREILNLRLLLVWTMVLVSVISWRSDTYYSGGLDPVVVAKAALSVLALGLSFLWLPDVGERRTVRARTVVLVCAYLSLSTLGAWAAGPVFASLVLAVRVLVILVVVLLVMTHPIAEVTRALFVGMVVVGLFCALTGLGSLATRGRLSGGIFPLNPNQIALLLGPPIIWMVWRMLRSSATRLDVIGVVVLSAMTWLTGSRTGLLALLVALVAMLMQARPMPVPAFLSCVAAVPAIGYLVLSTGLVSAYFTRGSATNVTTLSSRTIAWHAAFSAPADFWQHWFGGGIAIKTVAVTGTYWDSQVLDSSWVSGFVQAGWIGLVLLGLWCVTTLVAAFRLPRPWRMLWSAMALYCIVRSTMSSGLVDAHVLFVTMVVCSLAIESMPPTGKLAQDDDRRPARTPALAG